MYFKSLENVQLLNTMTLAGQRKGREKIVFCVKCCVKNGSCSSLCYQGYKVAVLANPC